MTAVTSLILALATGTAFATESAPQTDAPDTAPPTVAVKESYAAQVVLADAGALLGGLALTHATDRPIFLLSATLGAPIVHAAQGDMDRAVGSLALHATLPLAGAYLGLLTGTQACDHDKLSCTLGGIAVGALVGATSATLIDAAFLSSHTVYRPRTERAARRLAVPTVAIAPSGGVLVGLAGRM